MIFETKILPPEEAALKRAAQLLTDGEVVGIPTETVYGLAANAYNTTAIHKIFEAKGRPQDNPLIVHIHESDSLKELVGELPPTACRLAEAFWPGPLTMILPKSERVPYETTGGLDTIAVRMPSHPVARALIAACGFPLAAPSANLSGSPSPTTAEHVFHDMNGRIPLILDGGECGIGVESTVITVFPDQIRILRPGGITLPMLQTVVPHVEIDDGVLHQIADHVKAASPGMKYKHYAPKATVILLNGSLQAYVAYLNRHIDKNAKQTYALLFEGEEKLVSVPALAYGKADDGISQAHGLFACLRKLDELGAKTVYARCPQKEGVGLAVYNRLIRAAGFQVIDLPKEDAAP